MKRDSYSKREVQRDGNGERERGTVKVSKRCRQLSEREVQKDSYRDQWCRETVTASER